MEFKAGDIVEVEYRYRSYYKARVLWTETFAGNNWVTVKPLDDRMIFVFGSARDMGNGYKSYLVDITPIRLIEEFSPYATCNS